ncbi:MAG TPA: hypothetical protein VF657_24485, partial [Actinoplanes sp.]
LGDVPAADVQRLVALAEQQAGTPEPALVALTQQSRAVARNLLAGQYPEVAVLAAEEFPTSYRLVS